ncbi:hypothetical protein BD410DRAFT_619315 [Rickenella mellea]|uniref:DUF6534 domain-containing protein n=1 Tax=Rickenella mellea TaxID=50990 RepID=A0A4Y7PMB9_9AGAM|nr:hypothetical protein BD410DRAFT_619315 [Rickenella mellea]
MSQAVGPAHGAVINFYWGFVCSTALFGITINQSYTYFSNFDDGLAFRSLIAFLFVNDISSTILSSVAVHKILMSKQGNNPLVGSEESERYFAAESVQTLVITVATQMFFARQVYIVDSKKRTTSAVIVIFSVLAISAGLVRIVLMATSSSMEPHFTKVMATTLSENGCAAMSDIVATVAMCYKLVEASVDSQKMSSVVRTLMIYIFNRGIVVTAAQILIVVLYAYAPGKWYWLPVHMCVGKLYINTLLAMLNARRRLRLKAELPHLSDVNIKSSNIVINPTVDTPHEIVRVSFHPFGLPADVSNECQETNV